MSPAALGRLLSHLALAGNQRRRSCRRRAAAGAFLRGLALSAGRGSARTTRTRPSSFGDYLLRVAFLFHLPPRKSQQAAQERLAVRNDVLASENSIPPVL